MITQFEVKYDFDNLYNLFEGTTLFKVKEGNRKGFPEYRGGIFGYTRAWFGRKNGDLYDLSYLTKKHPSVYEELLNLGKVLKFDFKSIQVNKNLVCPPHKDKGNKGLSLLISFGDYEEGELWIDGDMYNAYHKATVFDGSKLEHYNNSFKGTKYSLIFYIWKTLKPVKRISINTFRVPRVA